MSFRIHFQDVPHSNGIKDECEALAATLRQEFPEVTKVEITLARDGDDYAVHLHVTGKDVSVNSTANSRQFRETVPEAFDKAHRQLRKHHDKQIFVQRRVAQKNSPK